ncbi:hypothetical protein MVES1_003856 [Malassezia vespertilionis]|uniref:uncharacterized protein n=1 Tax=Malassezia vespertilionis TaxID=2020962 RepID=UPI0024B104C3|nr:uncharacterized protein MVES1_003856 [Malassezia vespertilionis]WFD08480.1 hypothetical protein MVES1_003856 [Malassezia vespertilionis]
MSDTSVYQSGRPRRSTTQYDLSEKMEEEEASLAPTLKRQRGSRTLHRKTDHSVIERRRREKINDRLLCLQETVPACREKAFEHFKKKPCPHGTGTSAERIGSEMVLEKLCIISHTVDYVMELRKQLEAYRAMCTCEPEIPSPNEHTEEHAQFAHDGQPRTCTRSPNEDSLSPTPVKDEAMPIKEESKSLKLERKKHRTPEYEQCSSPEIDAWEEHIATPCIHHAPLPSVPAMHAWSCMRPHTYPHPHAHAHAHAHAHSHAHAHAHAHWLPPYMAPACHYPPPRIPKHQPRREASYGLHDSDHGWYTHRLPRPVKGYADEYEPPRKHSCSASRLSFPQACDAEHGMRLPKRSKVE